MLVVKNATSTMRLYAGAISKFSRHVANKIGMLLRSEDTKNYVELVVALLNLILRLAVPGSWTDPSVILQITAF